MAKKSVKKAHDPLATVRVDPPKSATPAKPEEVAASLGDAVVKSAGMEAIRAAALKAEKKTVVLPPRNAPKKAPKYMVLRDQTVHWKGQMLRFKAQNTILSDEKFGPGSIKKFRSMGVSIQEM